eukprot:jgi/Bigna1/129437/aug1.9_g4145
MEKKKAFLANLNARFKKGPPSAPTRKPIGSVDSEGSTSSAPGPPKPPSRRGMGSSGGSGAEPGLPSTSFRRAHATPLAAPAGGPRPPGPPPPRTASSIKTSSVESLTPPRHGVPPPAPPQRSRPPPAPHVRKPPQRNAGVGTGASQPPPKMEAEKKKKKKLLIMEGFMQKKKSKTFGTKWETRLFSVTRVYDGGFDLTYRKAKGEEERGRLRLTNAQIFPLKSMEIEIGTKERTMFVKCIDTDARDAWAQSLIYHAKQEAKDDDEAQVLKSGWLTKTGGRRRFFVLYAEEREGIGHVRLEYFKAQPPPSPPDDVPTQPPSGQYLVCYPNGLTPMKGEGDSGSNIIAFRAKLSEKSVRQSMDAKDGIELQADSAEDAENWIGCIDPPLALRLQREKKEREEAEKKAQADARKQREEEEAEKKRLQQQKEKEEERLRSEAAAAEREKREGEDDEEQGKSSDRGIPSKQPWSPVGVQGGGGPGNALALAAAAAMRNRKMKKNKQQGGGEGGGGGEQEGNADKATLTNGEGEAVCDDNEPSSMTEEQKKKKKKKNDDDGRQEEEKEEEEGGGEKSEEKSTSTNVEKAAEPTKSKKRPPVFRPPSAVSSSSSSSSSLSSAARKAPPQFRLPAFQKKTAAANAANADNGEDNNNAAASKPSPTISSSSSREEREEKNKNTDNNTAEPITDKPEIVTLTAAVGVAAGRGGNSSDGDGSTASISASGPKPPPPPVKKKSTTTAASTSYDDETVARIQQLQTLIARHTLSFQVKLRENERLRESFRNVQKRLLTLAESAEKVAMHEGEANNTSSAAAAAILPVNERLQDLYEELKHERIYYQGEVVSESMIAYGEKGQRPRQIFRLNNATIEPRKIIKGVKYACLQLVLPDYNNRTFHFYSEAKVESPSANEEWFAVLWNRTTASRYRHQCRVLLQIPNTAILSHLDAPITALPIKLALNGKPLSFQLVEIVRDILRGVPIKTTTTTTDGDDDADYGRSNDDDNKDGQGK